MSNIQFYCMFLKCVFIIPQFFVSLMVYKYIEKITKPKYDYSTFLKNDINSDSQKEILLNLYHLSKFYKTNKIQRNENPDKIDYKTTYNIRNRHSLHLLKIALLDNRPYKNPLPVEQSFYNLQNYIFILAMLKKRPDIVYQFIKSGFPKSVNSPVFGTDLSPTYFHLACVLSGEIMRLIMDYSPSHTLAWNGLTPQMLLLSKNHFLYDKQEWSFITTTQYELLNKYKQVNLIKNEEAPIFLLDFMCINNQIEGIKMLLKETNDLVSQSKYCFALSYNFGMMEVLAKYSIEINQSFSKISPLHVSAYIDDINHAITSLIVKMDCNLQDVNGDTPLHIAARLKHYTILELLIRYGGDINIKNNTKKSPKDFYDENGWKMVPPNYFDNDVLVNLADMDYNNPGFRCSTVSMKHIMNIKNFKKNSRFKITSLLGFYSKEKEAKKMIDRLMECDKVRYRTFKELDARFDQHLYKK